MSERLPQGLLQVYTGSGKGKTTAALGQTWRALAAGLRVCFLQFLKGGIKSSEQQMTSSFGSQLTFIHFDHPLTSLIFGGSPSPEDHQKVQEAWQVAQAALSNPDYDLVVLDEINNAMHHGLVDVGEVLGALAARPAHQEVICTGRNAPAALVEAADLVTEMRAIKHPYDEGLPARRGIEM